MLPGEGESYFEYFSLNFIPTFLFDIIQDKIIYIYAFNQSFSAHALIMRNLYI